MHPSVLVVAVVAVVAAALPANAQPTSASACASAIAQTEPVSGLPPGLLLAIALIETGRAVPGVSGVQPWPWSWNAAGRVGVAATLQGAVAAVKALRAGGVRSIDVGCMQINLLHHPAAFATLEQAFDPVANVRYAATFLSQLRARLPDWEAAIRRYHSGDPVRGGAYQRRVALAQIGHAWRSGAPATATIPLPPLGICAPGAQLVLVMRGTPDARVRHTGIRAVCLAPRRR